MKTDKPKSVTDLFPLTGKKATLELNIRGKANTSFRIPVTILGAREAFGRFELRVKNDHGDGEAWVGLDSVTV